MNISSLNIHFIANPVAGGGALRLIKRAEAIFKSMEVDVHLKLTNKKGDAELFARQISSEFRIPNSELSNTNLKLKTQNSKLLILIAGGDGTVNEVINGLLSTSTGKDIPVALLPVGITNVLAKELGIPEDIKKAIQLALTGSPKKISLGRINGRYFVSMAGIGFDGEVVFRLKQGIKRVSGKGAHILSGINCLINYNPPLIEIKTSNRTLTGYTAVVGKASCYGGYFKVTPGASLTEPLLDLCLFKGKTKKDLLRFIFGVIRKKHLNFKDIFYGKFSELEILSQGEVHIQIDGDYFGTLPVKIDVVKDAISLVW